MEGAGGNADDPSKSAKGTYVDPTADIDMDELPDNIREQLLKLREQSKSTFDQSQELERKRKAAEDFARKQQSRADQLEGIVKKHNLGGEPGGGNPPVSADAKQVQELTQRLVADGLKEEQAGAYAKMLATAGNVERDRIYREMAPLFAEVGSLRAESVLANARHQYKQVFDVPELSKAINDNVAVLLGQNKPVDDKTIQHLVSMAWGQYALANPDKIGKPPEGTVNNGIPQFGSPVTTGGHPNNPAGNNPQGPRVTQAETPVIMQNLNQFFEADLRGLRAAAGKTAKK